jgi:heat shock protein HspQ
VKCPALALPQWVGQNASMGEIRTAKFQLGQVVRHRFFDFRGVIFDVDPEFNNTEEWYKSIPLLQRPRKDQPYYHLLAENSETEYVAYVSEQNLLVDDTGNPVRHPQVRDYFGSYDAGRRCYAVKDIRTH